MTFQKLNLTNVDSLLRKRKMTKVQLAQKLEMSYVGLLKAIRENSTTLSSLLKIADALDVPVNFFFMSEDELEKVNGFSLERFIALQDEVLTLRKENEDLKNKIIRISDRF